jgi:alpha-1,3-glucosyltransferase
MNLDFDFSAAESLTRGLVGNVSFAVLPNITPGYTLLLTVAFQIVSSTIRIDARLSD